MILLPHVEPRLASSAGGLEQIMADITGTGADSPEDIKDEPALASVGVDPDTPVAADAEGPGQDDEEDDEFDDDDEDEAEEEAEDDEDDDTQKASETDEE